MKAGSLYRALLTPGLMKLGCDGTPSHGDAERRLSGLRELSSDLRLAHKFEVQRQGTIDDAELHVTAADFFREGVLRLPFDLCYFEFYGCVENNPSACLGALARQPAPCRVTIHPFLWTSQSGWLDPAMTASIDPMRSVPEQAATVFPEELYGGYWLEAGRVNCLRSLQYSIDLSLFLSTKHASTKPIAGATDRVNERRERAGKTPLFDHHIVTIAPEATIRAELGGTHASPRLHWRRGHIRTLITGARVPVKPALVGLAEKGFVSKDYAVAPPDKKGPKE